MKVRGFNSPVATERMVSAGRGLPLSGLGVGEWIDRIIPKADFLKDSVPKLSPFVNKGPLWKRTKERIYREILAFPPVQHLHTSIPCLIVLKDGRNKKRKAREPGVHFNGGTGVDELDICIRREEWEGMKSIRIRVDSLKPIVSIFSSFSVF